MKKSVLGAIMLVILGTSVAQAQIKEPLVSRDVGFFLSGVDPATGGVPFQVNNYTVAQTTCGLTPKMTPGTTLVVNPTFIRFDDPANPTGADCQVSLTSALQSIPLGTGYRAALRSRGATQVSAWSALSVNPFAVQAVAPDVPTGVRIVPVP